MKYTFIDLFAGVGGFRRGMELAGHKCVGYCEWDKYASASYRMMHTVTEEQREYLIKKYLKRYNIGIKGIDWFINNTINSKYKKKLLKEIQKEEYLNGEWFSNDIRTVDARSVPRCDVWCFGAPCQDFSIAGNRKGMAGDRSSLVREVFRVLKSLEETDKPEWIIYENVRGMLSSEEGFDFLGILLEMESLGYDVEYQLFNSKDFGVPQNRERVYTIGHLRRYGGRKILPIGGSYGEADTLQIAQMPSNKKWKNPSAYRVYDSNGLSPTLVTSGGGGHEPYVKVNCIGNVNPSRNGMNGNVFDSDGLSPTLTTNKGEGYKIAIPVLTPDRIEKRQNGRRFKEDGDPMFTLTTQDRHGVMVSELHKMRIRKLTPRECFRLQGWEDYYFDRAASINSDNQLYMQSGNGVTVTVAYAIAEQL